MLSPKAEVFLANLMTAPTVQGAAKAAGVSERQAHRWLREEEFAAAYAERRQEAVTQATARLQSAAGHAVSVLLAVMLDRNTPATSRVAAARTVLEMGARAAADAQLLERIERLEEALLPGA